MKIAPINYGARYSELTEKRNELSLQLSKVTAEQIVLAQNDEPEFESAELDDAGARRVAELLGQAPQAPAPTKRERLVARAQHIRDLRAAIGQLDGQLQVERHRAESDYRFGLAPDHRARLKAVVDAMQKVHAATVDVHLLVSAIEEQGISVSNLSNFSSSLLGSPTDPHSTMALFFREAVDMKLIASADVPKGLQYR